MIHLLDEVEETARQMPMNSIVVIAIFSSLFLLAIVLALILLKKSRKAAEQARLLNEKNQAEAEADD